MAKSWQLMAEYDAEDASYSACAGGAGSSPYSPLVNGRLTAIRCVPNGESVATLMEHVQIKLSSPTFKPNTIEVGAQGCGLRTAPAFMGGGDKLDWEVDQAVQVGAPITLEGRNVTADTPVGVSVLIYGLFEGR